MRASNERQSVPRATAARVLTASRRRCCICFGLRQDDAEKKGQIAHLDGDPAKNTVENLAFLCLEHHDQYDSRTSQSKGLTTEEVRRYRTELLAHVARTRPPSDQEIVAGLLMALDRPAFRTPFHLESSLPRFRAAIAETIETVNTGRTPQGGQIPSKRDIRDPKLRSQIDRAVELLVALRATFDGLLRDGSIKPCGCQDSDCPVYFFSDEAGSRMDAKRRELLSLARSLSPTLPPEFYRFD